MLTDLADKLRSYTGFGGYKLKVVEIAGWKSRGYAGKSLYDVAGHIFHHTASNQSSGLDVVTLNLCTYGRSDLPGPLCQLMLGRSGTVYVVAAGLANHAGPGSVGGLYRDLGNYYFIGTEMESSGTSNDWTSAQLEAMPHLGAALEIGYGNGKKDFYQLGHKEYSTMGKIDPAFIDMNKLRNDINTCISGGKLSDSGNNIEKDWFDMATKEELAEVVFRQVERAVTDAFTPGKPGVKFEGIPFRHLTRIEEKLDHVKNRVDIIWGGIFTDFSYTGNKNDLEPGIIKMLKENSKNTNNLDEKIDVLSRIASNGGTITNGAVSSVFGIDERKLREILDEYFNNLEIGVKNDK